MDKLDRFEALCGTIQQCTCCVRMRDSKRVLNRSSGSLEAKVMFIGEAPGRLGADETGIPFHGDAAGHNFEELLAFVGLDRSQVFITNAVLCNPRDHKGNNAPPVRAEIENCVGHLMAQIRLVQPAIVATLGSVALEATRLINAHQLVLREHVRTATKWYGRHLIPLYHPGQRAMLHRSLANQRSDYQFVAEVLKRLDQSPRKLINRPTSRSVFSIAQAIISSIGVVDYFVLHKLFYLLEYAYSIKYGQRLTNAYIVRQKDGPYCTDLHVQRLKRAWPELVVRKKDGSLLLEAGSRLFGATMELEKEVQEIVDDVIKKYGAMSKTSIKSAVYLTSPMRKLLKREQEGDNLYNTPIAFI